MGSLTACNGTGSLVSGTRPIGAPIFVGDVLYGTTSSGGPNCRDPFDDRAYDTGCGVLYSVDRMGVYRQLIAFDGRPLRAPIGPLMPGRDGWLYGATAPENSAAAIFRYSPSTGDLELVRDFTSEHVTYLFGLVIAPDGAMFALGRGQESLPTADISLFRIDRRGVTRVLHTFKQAAIALGAPTIGSDGTVYGSVTDGESCRLFSIAAEGKYRELYGGSCAKRDVPQSALVGPVHRTLYGLNRTSVVAIDGHGWRSVVFSLKSSKGQLVGAPVLREDGSIYVVEAMDSGVQCGSVLRIFPNRASKAIFPLARAYGRCWGPNDGFVYPRLTVTDAGIAMTTVSGNACGVLDGDIRVAEALSCGSVLRTNADSTIVYAHDFQQPAPVTDGGASRLRISLAGGNRQIRVVLTRPKHGDADHPFRVDPSKIDVALVDQSGAAQTLDADSKAEVASHWLDDGRDVAEVTYTVDRRVESGLYAMHVGTSGGGVLDARDEQLGLNEAPSVYVPPVPSSRRRRGDVVRGDDLQVDAARREFLGKTVFGYGGGIRLACEKSGAPVTVGAASAIVVDIYRALGSSQDMTYGASIGELPYTEFVSIDPIVVVFREAAKNAFAASLSGILAENVGMRPPTSDPASLCRAFTGHFSGLWDMERSLTPRSVADHTEWSAADRAAIEKQDPTLGMTPEMVAHIWGFPTTYGTAQKMFGLDDWEYEEPAPWGHAVRFKSGHAVSIRLPGNLP